MENVNKQLLERWAAFGKAMQKAVSELPRHLIAETEQIIAASEQAQQAVPVARDVLMQVAETVRDECASAWCDRANKEFEVDITSIVERYATTASQARAIINEQAEKLAKGRQQWEKVSQPPAVAVPDGVARAIEAVAAAIYFADSSDYLSTLWDTLRFLSPEIATIAESDTRAAWERAEQARAMLAAAQKGGA